MNIGISYEPRIAFLLISCTFVQKHTLVKEIVGFIKNHVVSSNAFSLFPTQFSLSRSNEKTIYETIESPIDSSALIPIPKETFE